MLYIFLIDKKKYIFRKKVKLNKLKKFKFKLDVEEFFQLRERNKFNT